MDLVEPYLSAVGTELERRLLCDERKTSGSAVSPAVVSGAASRTPATVPHGLIAGEDGTDATPSVAEPWVRSIPQPSTPRRLEIDTLYWGGGTPSQLPEPAFWKLVECIQGYFRLAPGYEWTVEANPGDVTPDWCRMVAEAGVTRVSLGVQSMQLEKLRILERDHTPAAVRQAVQWLRERGLVVAVDLIFAAPGETPDVWQQDLDATLQLQPDHVSTYGLTYELGTRFWSLRNRGQLSPVPEDREAQLYEMAIDHWTEAGYEHYEVSNFARAGFRCRHNETYWLGRDFYGFGPGAASLVHGTRTVNHRSLWTYLRRIAAGESPVAESETLSPEDSARERLVFGLRRLEGVDTEAFAQQTGFTAEQLAGEVLEQFFAWGVLARTGNRIHLTRRGLLISDWLWSHLVRC
jgi:oxygen-independent coproporphyrinogen-3 oxidase